MPKLILIYHHFQPPDREDVKAAHIVIELSPGAAEIVKSVDEDYTARLVTGLMEERTVADRALDRLCDDADPERTAQRIADFQREFALGALQRLADTRPPAKAARPVLRP